jgi:cytochrome oxidase assembly protein ShyY1
VTRDYRSNATRLLFAGAALLGVALFGSLGAWQWSRGEWKQALLAEREGVLSRRDAVALDAAFDPARGAALDWAAGRGRFDARLYFLDYQQRQGQAGVRVYGVLAAGAGPLLVELGWLPWGPGRALPAASVPSGDVEVAGVLAAPPSTGLALGSGVEALPGGGSRYLLTRIDLATLHGASGLSVPLAPRVLKLDPALPIGYARDLDLLPNTLPPERHRGYAVQWFALAATVAIVYLVLTVRAARRRKPPQ